MTEVGLRELRQNASELVRRVETGERLTVTVSGRPAAELVPVGGRQWLTWAEVEGVFASPSDASWAADRELVADEVRDPWVSG